LFQVDVVTGPRHDLHPHPRGAALESGRLVASSIYVWYASDFGAESMDVIRHMRRYAEPELHTMLSHMRHVSADRYDWALNEAQ
jgi:hypothetical protein